MVIAFNPENLTKLVIVVILVVTRPPLWRLDAPNIGQVHRDECDAGHMVEKPIRIGISGGGSRCGATLLPRPGAKADSAFKEAFVSQNAPVAASFPAVRAPKSLE
jgi:hypothetical protein